MTGESHTCKGHPLVQALGDKLGARIAACQVCRQKFEGLKPLYLTFFDQGLSVDEADAQMVNLLDQEPS